MTNAESESSRRVRAQRWLVPVLVVGVLAVMLYLLQHEIAHLRYHDILQAVREVPRDSILLALLCTVASYAVLPGYDLLALIYAGHRLPLHRIAYGSVVAYGLSQTMGIPALTGGSVRVRLWSSWGVGADEIARAVGFAGASFTLGILTLAGIVGLIEPATSLARLHIPVGVARGAGSVAVSLTVAYVILSFVRAGSHIRIWRFEVAVPRPSLVGWQLLVAAADWMLAALVLFVLLPAVQGHRITDAALVVRAITGALSGR